MGLILLRHTRPLRSDGICYGSTDLPPGPDLPGEARRLAVQLPPAERIVTSPLCRCRLLAEALATALGLALSVDNRLRELDFGRWEGQRWDRVPRDELDLWASDLIGARPHGGETVAEMAARVGEALDAVGQGVLLITHMGPIRAALARGGQTGAWEARVAFGAWVAV
ncbi:MAG: histidine phosphatase family protein [Paracoccaceae bacterium]